MRSTKLLERVWAAVFALAVASTPVLAFAQAGGTGGPGGAPARGGGPGPGGGPGGAADGGGGGRGLGWIVVLLAIAAVIYFLSRRRRGPIGNRR